MSVSNRFQKDDYRCYSDYRVKYALEKAVINKNHWSTLKESTKDWKGRHRKCMAGRFLMRLHGKKQVAGNYHYLNNGKVVPYGKEEAYADSYFV